jgi:hypothetical protein
LFQINLDVDRERTFSRECSDGGAKTALGEKGRVESAGNFADVFKRCLDAVLETTERCPDRFHLARDTRAQDVQLKPKRYEPLLCAVVEIPLHSTASLVSSGNDARSRSDQLRARTRVRNSRSDKFSESR